MPDWQPAQVRLAAQIGITVRTPFPSFWSSPRFFRRPFPSRHARSTARLWLRCSSRRLGQDTTKPQGRLKSIFRRPCPICKPFPTSTTTKTSKSASTTKSSPTSNAISCTAKSSAHKVNLPAVTNLTP